MTKIIKTSGEYRQIYEAWNNDFIFYKEWGARTRKEHKVEKSFFGLGSWHEWKKYQDAEPILVQVQNEHGGEMDHLLDYVVNSGSLGGGSKTIRFIWFNIGSNPEIQQPETGPGLPINYGTMEDIVSLRLQGVNFANKDEMVTIVVGRNWVTFVATIVIIVLIVIAIGGITVFLV